MLDLPQPLVLFDGVCNLCNGAVQFILKRDKRKRFYFAALQSKTGQQVMKSLGMSVDELSTMILVEGDRAYTHSSAVLRIARRLDGLWKVLFIFILIPPFVRNAVYRWVAKNRYHWFGKRDTCMVPTPELKARFLE